MTDESKQNDFVSATPLALEYRPPNLVRVTGVDLRLNMNYTIPQKQDVDEISAPLELEYRPTLELFTYPPGYRPILIPPYPKHDPDEFRNFILNNYEKTSTEQHNNDAVEFFGCISKYYDIFNKHRDDFYRYIDINKITNKELQRKMFDDILCDSSEFDIARFELFKCRSKFLREYRDEYSVVNKLMDIYNYKDLNFESTKRVKLIKDQLDSYLLDKIRPTYYPPIESINRVKLIKDQLDSWDKIRPTYYPPYA